MYWMVGNDVHVTMMYRKEEDAAHAGRRSLPPQDYCLIDEKALITPFSGGRYFVLPSYDEVYRIVGGGGMGCDADGDLVVTFVPPGDEINETMFYQVKAKATTVEIAYTPFFAREKLLRDGTAITKTYAVPTARDSTYRRKPYYVAYWNDGDWVADRPTSLILRVLPEPELRVPTPGGQKPKARK